MTPLEKQLAEALQRARPFVERFYEYQHSIDEASATKKEVDEALAEYNRQLSHPGAQY